MSKAIEFDQDNRVRRAELHSKITAIEQHHEELKVAATQHLRDGATKLYMKEKEFQKKAAELLNELPIGTLLHIKTQVGPNCSVIQDYPNATLETKYGYGEELYMFTVSTPERGKFGIGLSCLLYIDVK